VALRGNVDTRLRKCREGVVDAIVLARAGLVRLGLSDVPTEVLEPERFLPALGQGALAVEQRAGDEPVSRLLAQVTHVETKLCVLAERGVLAAVSGDCQTPVAAYAVRRDSELWLRGLLSEPDGSRVRRRELRAPWPSTDSDAEAIGRRLGLELVSG
jgi:hydroxymethylbilane synthase